MSSELLYNEKRNATVSKLIRLICLDLFQIGQRHGGFLGILQRALARASPHIWFERGEVKDREAVTQRYVFSKLKLSALTRTIAV